MGVSLFFIFKSKTKCKVRYKMNKILTLPLCIQIIFFFYKLILFVIKASYWSIFFHSFSPKVWRGLSSKKVFHEGQNFFGQIYEELFCMEELMIRSCQKWRDIFTNAFSINLNTVNLKVSSNLCEIHFKIKR